MRNLRIWVMVVVAAALVGCGTDEPTAVGTDLLPAGLVRTYEVVLDASEYLVLDTAFSGYRVPFDAPFLVVANAFEDVLDAHALARLQTQSIIMVADSQGFIVPDSTPRYLDGELLLRFDTTATTATGPVTLRASRISEVWDVRSMSWDLRVDTADTQIPWTQPGGTTDAIAGEAEWDMESDSVLIPIDSAAIAAWSDTTSFLPGVMVESLTPDVRLRVIDLQLIYRAASEIDPDTTVELNYRPGLPGFIYTPELSTTSSAPHLGGLPAWRTVLQLVDRLDRVRVPCPPGAIAGCRLPLGALVVNSAELLLEPVQPPAGFAAEDSMGIGVIPMFATADVPLSRSPLAGGAPGSTGQLSAQRLTDPDGDPIAVPVTGIISLFAADSATVNRQIPPYLAMIAQTEGLQQGFAVFAAGPTLRLIVTLSSSLEIR